jgi:hypothetical protein
MAALASPVGAEFMVVENAKTSKRRALPRDDALPIALLIRIISDQRGRCLFDRVCRWMQENALRFSTRRRAAAGCQIVENTPYSFQNFLVLFVTSEKSKTKPNRFINILFNQFHLLPQPSSCILLLLFHLDSILNLIFQCFL